MSAFEERVGYPEGAASVMEEKLRKGEVAWVILSGKMASGKDTLAPLVKLPGKEREILSYGNILRENLSLVMDSAFTREQEAKGYGAIVDEVKAILGYSQEASKEFTQMVWRRFVKEGALNPYERTNFMRTLLQKMGSDWLPYDDYLPVCAAGRAHILLNNGTSVIAAGSRFLPDVEIPRLAGGITVRLDVTEETQLRRLQKRDNLPITDELLTALHHPGELELDDYPHDIRVDNNTDGDEAFQKMVEEVNSKITKIMEERRNS